MSVQDGSKLGLNSKSRCKKAAKDRPKFTEDSAMPTSLVLFEMDFDDNSSLATAFFFRIM